MEKQYTLSMSDSNLPFMVHPGILFVVSGPSGSGKTTLCRMVEDRLGISHSVSCTTRPPRGSEVDGKDYRFVDDAAFDQMIQSGVFLEWAQVHGNRYGTPLNGVLEAKRNGKDLILDLDTQGALIVHSKDPDALLVFIDIPDSVLEERLGRRGTEDYDKMRKRLSQARRERESKDQYDIVVVNDDLEEAYRRLEAFVEKERAKRGGS